MKNIQFIYLFMAFTILCTINEAKAQLTIMSPFEGTWEHIDGNKKFVVSLWKEENDLLGHYKMINTNNNTILYSSYKLLTTGQLKWTFAINTTIYNLEASGIIIDNSVSFEPTGFIEGYIRMDIQSGTTPLTIHWRVYEPEGLKIENQPDFNIPTDIVLTKVSNEINLE
ncbi:hypothetical protein E0W68_00290 [Flavobacterium salilacus subsp. salilacus]|uniref:hypothetical protein n=1 Tax=Flavobacterium TaxID=237 RepID=UPI0010757602|nr:MULTISPECIES: hypothetical protein [Flavobacterium]KAF2519710.1 hypothetical protein E0W68_00290 [Flavobacterium salilacus subsp. salilacus]MBE1614401.1 hypothetical protein [Flavobacterium sp. SaA2.13]